MESSLSDAFQKFEASEAGLLHSERRLLLSRRKLRTIGRFDPCGPAIWFEVNFLVLHRTVSA